MMSLKKLDELVLSGKFGTKNRSQMFLLINSLRDDLNSVIGMLDGTIDKRLVKNFIKRYLIGEDI